MEKSKWRNCFHTTLKITFSQFFEASVTNSFPCQYCLHPLLIIVGRELTCRISIRVFKSFSRITLSNSMRSFHLLLQASSVLILWSIAKGNFQTAIFHLLIQNSSKVPLWYLSAMKDMSSKAVTPWLAWNLVGHLADHHIAVVSVCFPSLINNKINIPRKNNGFPIKSDWSSWDKIRFCLVEIKAKNIKGIV